MLEDYPDLIDIRDLQEILKIKRYSAINLIHNELSAFKQSGHWLITKESLILYIEDMLTRQE